MEIPNHLPDGSQEDGMTGDIRIGGRRRYDKAAEAFNLCLSLYQSIDDKVGILNIYNNIGNMLRMSGKYDQALHNFIESMRMSEELGHKKGIAYASLNIGLIYATRLGESEDLRKYALKKYQLNLIGYNCNYHLIGQPFPLLNKRSFASFY